MSLFHSTSKNDNNGMTIMPYPVSTPSHQCNEIPMPEGAYTLAHEIFLESTQPQFYQGTTVSSFCSLPQQQLLTIPQPSLSKSVRTSSTSSSIDSLIDDIPTLLDTANPGNPLSNFFTKHHSRKRPKSNMSKLKSCFVDYSIPHEQLSAKTSIHHLFFNIGYHFFYFDQYLQPKDALLRLCFGKAYITCHDVNLVTSNTDHLDIIIGFSTGDFIWYDLLCNRYTRLNKHGIMNNSKVTKVKWIPGSEDLFIASFEDGSILILDKDKDDQAFSVSKPTSWAEEYFQVTKPNKNNKYNPVAHWRISNQGITSFEFSPNHKHIAVTGKDGLLRIIDYTNERLCDVFEGFYGHLLCVAWSPDGHYILTGGQDDLVTIWSFKESKIIARCQGHRSWVTGAAFDPMHCDDKDYRFASVGEDGNILLWDFSVKALHKPKQRKFSTYEEQLKKTHKKKIIRVQNPIEHIKLPIFHPVLGKCQVPILQPIVMKTIHPDPCRDISFKADSIITTDRRGRIRIWNRPSLK